MNWQQWVEFAEENFLATLENKEKRGLSAILLAHQAAEKYLKAVWIKQERLPERSHDLVLLLKTIEPNPTNELLQAARELNYFLPRARYPNGPQKPSPESVEKVIQSTILLRAFARDRLGLENT